MRMAFNVPAWGYANERLDALAVLKRLIPVRDLPTGCRGQSYRPAVRLAALTPWSLEVDGAAVTVDLYRLPSSALQSLLSASEHARVFDTTVLETQLEAGAVQGWWPQVLDVVHSGAATHHTIQSGPLEQTVQWMPDETRLTRSAAGWTLTFAYEIQTFWRSGPRDQVVGVDVGVSPLATVRAPGLALSVPGVWIPHPDQAESKLSRNMAFTVRQVSRSVVYGVARRRWEGLIGAVIPHASVVGVEDLERSTLKSNFRRLCTDVAIQDALMAWWPQLAREAGVQLVRVDPALTSRTCSQCARWGDRSGAQLTCEQHGPLNVHEEAAELIRILAIAKVLSGRQAQAAARRGR